MVIAHMRKLRQNDYLASALGVIIIEANHQVDATNLRDQLKKTQEPGIIMMQESKGVSKAKDQPGIITTEVSKQRMVFTMIDLLRLKKICFSDQFIRAIPNENPLLMDLESEFEKQMRKFSKKRMVTRDHRNDVDKIHFTYSGKVVGENDDLVMAAMFAPYARSIFFSPENRIKYGNYW